MRRQPLLRHLWLALVIAACPPAGQPTLELSVGTARVDSDVSVGVTATAADGTPGQGSVSVSTSVGTLAASTLMLTEGSGRTTLKCARSTSGCSAGATIDVTARWTLPGGTVVTAAKQVRLIDPQPVDAGTTDAGATDAGGTDAGDLDAGWPDAGEPELDAGTPLGLSDGLGLVLGRFGPPSTIGFSSLSSNATVFLGFDTLPEQSLVFGDRLVYVRRGVARVWEEDYVDGGPPRDAGFAPVIDAGAPDAGRDGGLVDGGATDAGGLDGGPATDAGVDGGASDGGRLDAGFDAGLPPQPFILYPEVNDPIIATCTDAFPNGDAGYVRAVLPTPSGRLWTACSANAFSEVSLFISGSDLLSTNVSGLPLAAHDGVVLMLAADAGVYLVSTGLPVSPPDSMGRRYARAARAVPGGFELLAWEPSTDRCVLATMSLSSAQVTTRQLPPTFPDGIGCLDSVFSRSTDTLFSVGLAGNDLVVFAWPLSARSPADGGVVFTPGPPSNLRSDPPTLAVDFSSPVEVVGR